MDERSVEIREITINSVKFLQNFNLNIKSCEESTFDLNLALRKFDNLLENSLLPLKNQKIALLFSGGLDSSLLAFKLNKLNIKYQPILVANRKDIDYKNAVEVAKLLNLDLKIIELDAITFELIIPKIMKIIETTEEKQINISAPFYLAADYLTKNDFHVAILGQGADELFCGYQRYVDYIVKNPNNFRRYHLKDIKKSVIKNFTRDHAIFSSMGVILYLPYLHEEIVKLTFSLPNHILINSEANPIVKKNFLRLYAKVLDLDEKIIQKKKVAIQFGSGSYRLLRKLALKHGFTKEFSSKHGYLAHAQLYLDYLAQKNNIKNFDLKIEK